MSSLRRKPDSSSSPTRRARRSVKTRGSKPRPPRGRPGMPAIADDSGLEVDALDGRPGVYSKRYGGFTDDDERNASLLKQLENEEHRAARFVCCIVCCFPDGGKISAEGECRGAILRAARGSGGFGYDPVFLVEGAGKSMAELTDDEKNAVSHRGQALRVFVPKLRERLRRHTDSAG